MKTVFFYLCLLGLHSFASEIRSYRLSTDVIPNHYSIKIHPDIDNDIFYGEVSIYVRTRTNLDKITLHASQLNFTEVSLNYVECTFDYEENEKVSLRYRNNQIQPGDHIIKIKYVGEFQKNGTGFLKVPCKHHAEGFILVTDLEPTSARRVFPCFDEPSFKAKYDIRLVAPDESYTAISNMPEVNKFITKDGIIHEFATSLTMSTYLVSFALTKYPYYEDVFQDGDRLVPIRIFAFNASEEANAFAMNCTKRALQFYTEYTNISYPLTKLDLIEYTRLETAATENWGLVTFREGLLSLNLDIYDEMQIKVVMYHEISHFWFGNLVTNDWWNDLWLQEGFATYMSYKVYSTDDKVKYNEISFFFDGFFELENKFPSRPIVEYLSSQEDIMKRFESATYYKGAAILFMLEDVLGKELFQKVTQEFLRKHAYKSATTNDFIIVLEEVVPHMKLRDFLESYLYQTRLPMITVDSANGTFILKQQVCATLANFSDFGLRWSIPIKYVTDINREPTFVMFDKDMDSLNIAVPDAKWIILNSQGTGIYRVLFSENQWKVVTEHFQALTTTEKMSVISDANYSYRFGLVNCDVVLSLMEKINDTKLWSSFAEFHLLLQDQLQCNKYNDELVAYINFLKKLFEETGYPRHPKVKTGVCLHEDAIATSEKDREALQKCTKWIRENLPYSINNFTEAIDLTKTNEVTVTDGEINGRQLPISPHV